MTDPDQVRAGPGFGTVSLVGYGNVGPIIVDVVCGLCNSRIAQVRDTSRGSVLVAWFEEGLKSFAEMFGEDAADFYDRHSEQKQRHGRTDPPVKVGHGSLNDARSDTRVLLHCAGDGAVGITIAELRRAIERQATEHRKIRVPATKV